MGKAIGTPVKLVDVPRDAARADLLSAGLPASQADALLMLFDGIRAGKVYPPTQTVADLLSRPGRSLDDWLADIKLTERHLTMAVTLPEKPRNVVIRPGPGGETAPAPAPTPEAEPLPPPELPPPKLPELLPDEPPDEEELESMRGMTFVYSRRKVQNAHCSTTRALPLLVVLACSMTVSVDDFVRL